MSDTFEIKLEMRVIYIQEIKPLNGYTKEYVLERIKANINKRTLDRIKEGVVFSGLNTFGSVGAKLWDSEANEWIAEVISQTPDHTEVTIIEVEGEEL